MISGCPGTLSIYDTGTGRQSHCLAHPISGTSPNFVARLVTCLWIAPVKRRYATHGVIIVFHTLKEFPE